MKQQKTKNSFQNAGEFDDDLLFVFRHAQIEVEFDDAWDDSYESYQFKKQIKSAIAVLSDEINIDKTYVSYADSKYKKTFIDEDMWLDLCRLEAQTNFGKNATNEQRSKLVSFYVNMMVYYIIMCLDDLDLYAEGMFVYMNEKSKFIVEIMKNPIKNDNYSGPWQTW